MSTWSGFFERSGRAVVGGVVEVPPGRCGLPDEFIEVVQVLRIASPADFAGEVVAIPDREGGLRWKRRDLGNGGVVDEIAADGDDGFAAFGPEGWP